MSQRNRPSNLDDPWAVSSCFPISSSDILGRNITSYVKMVIASIHVVSRPNHFFVAMGYSSEQHPLQRKRKGAAARVLELRIHVS